MGMISYPFIVSQVLENCLLQMDGVHGIPCILQFDINNNIRYIECHEQASLYRAPYRSSLIQETNHNGSPGEEMNSFSVFSIHTLPSSSSHPSPYFTAPFGTATCSIHSLFIFLLSYLHMILIKGRNDATRFNFLFQNINSIKVWFCLHHIIIFSFLFEHGSQSLLKVQEVTKALQFLEYVISNNVSLQELRRPFLIFLCSCFL